MRSEAELLKIWRELSETEKQATFDFIEAFKGVDSPVKREKSSEIVMDQVMEGNHELLEEMRH